MKKASITETKNQLSALLDRVRHGESILIVDRGRPVARLESVVSGGLEDLHGRLARLERHAVVRRAAAPPPRTLLARRPPQPRPRASASRTLIDERRESR